MKWSIKKEWMLILVRGGIILYMTNCILTVFYIIGQLMGRESGLLTYFDSRFVMNFTSGFEEIDSLVWTVSFIYFTIVVLLGYFVKYSKTLNTVMFYGGLMLIYNAFIRLAHVIILEKLVESGIYTNAVLLSVILMFFVFLHSVIIYNGWLDTHEWLSSRM